MNTRWEQKIELARAKRLARACEFAARRGLSIQAGEHLAAAVDAEPGLNLSLIDQFPPGMREAAAAILPRAAHGPDHEPAARDHLATAARMASGGRHHEAARWLAEAGREVARADERRMRAEELRADERAQAARSVECPCQAGRGDPCGPSGDHLARYLRAEQCGAITRDSLTEVITSLDVIAPQVTIRPLGERATRATHAETADQILCACIDAGMRGTRIEASAEAMLAGRLDQPTATLGPSHCGHDGAACDAREAPELEAGASPRAPVLRRPTPRDQPSTPAICPVVPRWHAAPAGRPETGGVRAADQGRSGMSDTIHRMVTERMIAALERDTVPWHKPWQAADGRPTSMTTAQPYRGVNVFLLGLTVAEEGYGSRYWGTYRQITQLGGQVRRGEHSTLVLFWKPTEVADRDPRTGEVTVRQVPVLRYYRVFNAAQADHLPDRFHPAAEQDARIRAPQTVVDGYLARGPALRHVAGDRAGYQPATDMIRLPLRAQFRSADHYYATAFHEAAHSTGHPSRLDRPGIAAFDHYGSDKYAREELVAEMTSSILCAETGIDDPELFDNSAGYIAGWLSALNHDRTLVVAAAAHAQRACDLISQAECEAMRDASHQPEGSTVVGPRYLSDKAGPGMQPAPQRRGAVRPAPRMPSADLSATARSLGRGPTRPGGPRRGQATGRSRPAEERQGTHDRHGGRQAG